jgi:hypothetical protein
MSKSRKRARKFSEDPATILAAMAYILNAAEKAGLNPKMKHGIIWTDAGYVLPAKGDKWAARPLKKK